MHDLNTLRRLNEEAVLSGGTSAKSHEIGPLERYTNNELIRELEIRGFRAERNTLRHS